MEAIDGIRATYANNLFRIVRQFGGFYGKLTYSRALPKYKVERLSMESVDQTKPCCVYTENADILAILTTVICHEGKEFLRYLEVARKKPDEETELGAILYNYKTNSIRLLIGDESIIAFLLLLPPPMLPDGWQENLKLI
jgi:hypothetical protein